MKKIILLFGLASLAISNNLFSQKKIDFGFYIGTSMTSHSGAKTFAEDLSEFYTQLLGIETPMSESPRVFLINGGSFISYNFSPTFALKGGIEYAPKGQKYKGEVYLSTNMNLESTVLLIEQILHVNYLEFPFSVQFSTKSKATPDKIYGYLNLGLSPAVLVFSEISTSTRTVKRGFDNSGVTEEPIDSEYNTQELNGMTAMDCGAFCSIGISGGRFLDNWSFDLKYERGLIDITEVDETTDFRNNILALTMGWKFKSK